MNKFEPNSKRHTRAADCKTCGQSISSEDTLGYVQHPAGAVEERVGISDKRLSLFENKREYGDEATEEAPVQCKVTDFTVYDKEGHVCRFDTGLIENNKQIFFSGHLKHVTCEDPAIEDGIPVFDCGPIDAWWNSYDGGEKTLTSFTTALGEYYLMKPSQIFAPFIKDLTEKNFAAKCVIEYLQENVDAIENLEYEDLLNHMDQIKPPDGTNIGVDALNKHAGYVVKQVCSYEEAGEDEPSLITSPCMRALVKLSEGKTLMERESEMRSKQRKRRCGVCDTCTKVDCGCCTACRGMTKFGGNGRAKQACQMRKCSNMDEDEKEIGTLSKARGKIKVRTAVTTCEDRKCHNLSSTRKKRNCPKIDETEMETATSLKTQEKIDNETAQVATSRNKRKCREIEGTSSKKLKVQGKIDIATAQDVSEKETATLSKQFKPQGEIDVATAQVATTRCNTCGQLNNSEETLSYSGHPFGSVEELVALKYKCLSLTGDDENNVETTMQCKLTNFTVYDKEGHLVPFDTNLIENNKEIFFSGYLKHLTCEDQGNEDLVPVCDCGPIDEWWMAGFDGGDKSLVGFSTSLAEYYLMESSEMYAPFMKDVHVKSFVTKCVIEYLEQCADKDETVEYEDLLQHLSEIATPDGVDNIDDDTILKHADFIVNQVHSYDVADDTDEEPMLVNSPCMTALINLAGIKLAKKKLLAKKAGRMKRRTFRMCTVTNLVRDVFEELFQDQMVETECDNSINEEESLPEEDCMNISGSEFKSTVKQLRHSASDFKWEGEKVKINNKSYFKSALIDGKLSVSAGDTVLVLPEDPSVSVYVAKIVNMYQIKDEDAMVHLQWFFRGTDTCLGEASDPTELFYCDDCEDEPLVSIFQKCTVEKKPIPDQAEWKKLGCTVPPPTCKDDGKNFWVSLWYDPEDARFEYPKPLPENKEDKIDFCGTCTRCNEIKMAALPVLGEKSNDGTYNSLMWDYKPLKVGDCVYLEPDSVCFKIKQKLKPEGKEIDLRNVDSDLYPELYRKNNYVKGTNASTPDPFQLALIKSITKRNSDVRLKVQVFYRPENTHKGWKAAESAALNMIYWSEEEATVPFQAVRGRCLVQFADVNMTDQQLDLWAEEGPDRWYFREMYNSQEKSFHEPPLSSQRIGQKEIKGKGRGKSSVIRKEESTEKLSSINSFPPVAKKLRCLDVFAGCGGLSRGLHEAGVAECKWAIEVLDSAAQAYKLNNPDCTVFTDDCNMLLKSAMDGIEVNQRGQKIPQPGEVDLLCGGPPCQGFSGMNRFNHREYSQFKNSLVSTYLSYLEFYRPRYFILENVRNFASFKKSMVLRLCMRAMIKMGYQCTFGILQAGQFGVAQTRRRVILLAAAPGETLPLYPEPRHVFSPQACHLSVEIENKKYFSNCKWINAGPYRTITVRDTLSDLPKIKNGDSKVEMSYLKDSESHFQKKVRGDCQVLRDHICKDMSALAEARMARIPVAPGSDWRDLPNSVITLKDGTKTSKLVYGYEDYKQGRSSTGALRGVCSCSNGKNKCSPADRQQNTLIPWSLPHTANRNNQWAGLYGRVEMEGFFGTTTTNPEPICKQGRVLHPDQSRVVSVRECARSQGFPDSYMFCGTISDKYRQVGNAVAPPMGKFLGLEIRIAMAKSEEDKTTEDEEKKDEEEEEEKYVKMSQLTSRMKRNAF